MRSKKFSEKLKEISKVIARNGDGISYIHNEDDVYTIGTRKYDRRIAQYLDQTVKSWKGSEASLANLKKKKGKEGQNSKIAYLWKIPLTEDNELFIGSESEA